jgi:hypothetical protein
MPKVAPVTPNAVAALVMSVELAMFVEAVPYRTNRAQAQQTVTAALDTIVPEVHVSTAL